MHSMIGGLGVVLAGLSVLSAAAEIHVRQQTVVQTETSIISATPPPASTFTPTPTASTPCVGFEWSVF
jgi:hypothetical protein